MKMEEQKYYVFKIPEELFDLSNLPSCFHDEALKIFAFERCLFIERADEAQIEHYLEKAVGKDEFYTNVTYLT